MPKKHSMDESAVNGGKPLSEVHMNAHGFIPKTLTRLLGKVGYNSMEAERIEEKGYQTPHKYHPLTVIDSLVEKLSEPTAKRSVAKQLTEMANPAFASSFMKQAVKHLSREKY